MNFRGNLSEMWAIIALNFMIHTETLVYFAGDVLHHCHTDHGLDISIVYLMDPSLGWMQTIPACTYGQSFLDPKEINLVCG